MIGGQRRSRLSGVLLLAPALLIIAAVAVYPMVRSFILSFQDWRFNKSPVPTGFVGLEQYAYAFQDRIFINSIKVTFLYTVLSVGMTIVLGLAVALILQKPTRLNLLVRSVLIFPYAVSAILKGFSFRFMLNEQYGILQLIIKTHCRFLARYL